MTDKATKAGTSSEKHWRALAAAIVVSAVKDYRMYRKKIRAGKELSPYDISEYQDIERFFLSSDFEFYTDMNGAELLEMLQNENTYVHTGSIID